MRPLDIADADTFTYNAVTDKVEKIKANQRTFIAGCSRKIGLIASRYSVELSFFLRYFSIKIIKIMVLFLLESINFNKVRLTLREIQMLKSEGF